MKKILLGITIVLASKLSAQNWKNNDQYVQKFAAYAVEEMEKYQIPASITLAQGILETGGGQSRLAQLGNNHFGIKCKENWTGKTMAHTDDAPNECFRVYDDVKQSFEDHSKFLRYRKYYQKLFDLDVKDYKGWAHGLKKAGYATNPKYAYILINYIEKYRLYEFDNTNSKEVLLTVLKLYPELRDDKTFMAQIEKLKNVERFENDKIIAQVPYKTIQYTEQKSRTNDVKSDKESLQQILVKTHPNEGRKFIIIPADTNVDFIAKKFKISEFKILKWNELNSSQLKKNDIVFLESKGSQGNIPTYRIQVGETMYDVAQKFGIKLSKLYSRNRMNVGENPKIGQLLYLQGKKPRS